MTRDHLIAIEVVFYRTAAGAEPVRDWLRGMPAADRRTIGTDLATVQFGWPVGMPLCRPLGGGLWGGSQQSSRQSHRVTDVLRP
jgi:hypothetical protein